MTRSLLLLLLLATVGFGGEVTRLLAARLGHIPLARVSRGLLATTTFGVALWLCGGVWPAAVSHAVLAALVVVTALEGMRFSVRATRVIAPVLGVHPFRVRGAVSWCRIA